MSMTKMLSNCTSRVLITGIEQEKVVLVWEQQEQVLDFVNALVLLSNHPTRNMRDIFKQLLTQLNMSSYTMDVLELPILVSEDVKERKKVIVKKDEPITRFTLEFSFENEGAKSMWRILDKLLDTQNEENK